MSKLFVGLSTPKFLNNYLIPTLPGLSWLWGYLPLSFRLIILPLPAMSKLFEVLSNPEVFVLLSNPSPPHV